MSIEGLAESKELCLTKCLGERTVGPTGVGAQNRPREQIFETLTVNCELLPGIPGSDPLSFDNPLVISSTDMFGSHRAHLDVMFILQVGSNLGLGEKLVCRIRFC
jgi:hypothetical protein